MINICVMQDCWLGSLGHSRLDNLERYFQVRTNFPGAIYYITACIPKVTT